MVADIEEFRRRKARSALMFAERALADAEAAYTVEPDEHTAGAIGHLRLVVSDLTAAVADEGEAA